MKKIYMFCSLMVLFFLLFSLSAAKAAVSDMQQLEAIDEMLQSTLPESLIVIEEDAFEGTSLVAVQLPEGVTTIGNHAFANIERLFVLHISSELKDIEGNPFEGSPNVLLSGFGAGYGKNWAKENGIIFLQESSFAAREEPRIFAVDYSIKSNVSGKTERINEKADWEHKDFRTGRTNGELKASIYSGAIALYVRSRYFP